ncbi:hypothetical protein ACFL6A_02610 [bacterium]
MKCRECQRLIVQSTPDQLSLEVQSELTGHLSQCSDCASLESELETIRTGIKKWPVPELSEKLDEETRTLCHAQLAGMKKHSIVKRPSSSILTTPRFIWAILISLVILSLFWIIPTLKDFQFEEPMNFKTSAALAFLIQNSLMLIFSPLLLRPHRWAQRVPKNSSRLLYR